MAERQANTAAEGDPAAVDTAPVRSAEEPAPSKSVARRLAIMRPDPLPNGASVTS